MEIFPPYLTVVLAGIFGILVFSFYTIRRSKDAKTKLPPEAGGAWPIVGHLHLLSGRSNQLPHITLGNMAEKYGPIFMIRIGIHKAMVVSSREVVKEIFTTHDVAVTSRPKLVSFRLLAYNYASFGFSPYGAYWREMRKITTLELLSNRRLELLKHVRASEVDCSIKELYQLWSQKNDSSGRVLIEMKQRFGDLALNIIIRMVAGKRYFGASANHRDEKEARKCQKVMRDFFELLGVVVVRDALPFLGWLDIGGYEKAMKKTAKELDNLANDWLQEHLKKRASGETKSEQDFMDVLLTILDGTSYGGFDSDTIIKATSMILIAGGSDTIVVTLTWALSLILNNRHVLKKAQKELDFHIGRERLVEESDISKLVYLQAIFKETLRMHPVAPLSNRLFTESCTVGGYQIPEGTRLMVNLWKIQNDPHIWPNPHEFKPERFLTTHKDVDVRGHHFELIPFGTGRRACPGTSFGLQVVHLALAKFLHAFDIWTPSDAPVDMAEIFGLTSIKATPLEVLVTPRLSPSLYE